MSYKVRFDFKDGVRWAYAVDGQWVSTPDEDKAYTFLDLKDARYILRNYYPRTSSFGECVYVDRAASR